MRLLVARTLAVLFSLSILGALIVHASCTHTQDSIAGEPQRAPPLSTQTTAGSAAATAAPAVQADDDEDRFLPATKAAPVFVPRKSKSKPIPQKQAVP